MTKKLTVTIGIPAYNEQENIQAMLKSVLAQKGNNFVIKKIVVVSDGSSDQTVSKVKEIQKESHLISLVEGKTRKGKIIRLNKIYSLNKSDILFTFDADIVLAHDEVIQKVVNAFNENVNISVAVCHQVPVGPTNFVESVIYRAYRIWEDTRIPVNDGDHIHNLQGSASALSKNLAAKMKYPRTLGTDSGYLYLMGKKYGGFKYVSEAPIYYRTAKTIEDFRKLSLRTLDTRFDHMVAHMGAGVLSYYRISSKYKTRALIDNFIKDPIYTVLAMMLNIYVRIFPIKRQSKSGAKWDIVVTSKDIIEVNNIKLHSL